MSVHLMQAVLEEIRRGHWISYDCEPPCGAWESNLSPRQDGGNLFRSLQLPIGDWNTPYCWVFWGMLGIMVMPDILDHLLI